LSSSNTTFDGRTALVTGATSGIGRAVAERLAAGGARVLVHGRDPERGKAAVRAIEERGGSARFVAAALDDSEDVLRLAAEAGEVDILVNNAAVFEFAPTADTGTAGFDRHFAINTRAPFLLVGALAPGMAERGYGVIVNIGSTASRLPAPVGAAYGASKAGLNTLTRYWANEFGARGVRVNAVSSGPVRTEGSVAMLGEAIDTLGSAANVRGRLGEPEEIAEAVAFLASPVSGYVNGAILVADGGEPTLLPG
jgi:NAD(P)-dependent dehydrogenase (short-subunit alcohol dehydrogenase family)